MAKSFRLRQDAKEWFSNIDKSKNTIIKTDFDLYYFCLMIGLAVGRFSNPTERCPHCNDFIDEFVKDYRPQQNLIVGLLIKAELSNFGINLEAKNETKELLLKLIDPHTITNLTDMGMDKMNCYASGGFDYMTENFDLKPYNIEEFLITYVNFLREAIDNNSAWQININASNYAN